MEQKTTNYDESKIYKIVCNITGLVYIGSTTKKYLSQRLQGHLKSYRRFKNGKTTNKTSSFVIFDNGDYDIILIENFPCKTKDELRKRERHFIESIECVNIKIPSRTCKEYHQIFRDKINETNLKRWHDNKETNLKKQKERYYEDHEKSKESANARTKTYVAKHNIYETRKLQKYECECGSVCRLSDKSTHFKTKKHIDFINNQIV